MGNSPSEETAADDPPGEDRDAPAGMMDSPPDFTHYEIIAPPPADAAGQCVILE